jgi:DNA repair exonuclease SbcCD ATPase subunit
MIYPACLEKQVTQVLTEQTTNSYSDTLNLLQQEIKLLKSQVSHFQHEAHRLRVAAASASPEHVRKASTSSDDRDLDARMASLELGKAGAKNPVVSLHLIALCEESELAACRQREELLARQLQELLHATESRQMTFEAEAGQLQHALVQSKEYNQALTDRMDELKHQMQEMEMDSLHGGGSGSLELSMAEELNPHLSHKLSPEEEGKIIRELAELVRVETGGCCTQFASAHQRLTAFSAWRVQFGRKRWTTPS